MSEIKLSIIIPALQEEKTIIKLLENLQDIHSFSYEVIVSDGGSKDKTVELAKSFGAIVVENKTDQRQTIAQGRNAGAQIAKGELILFLDADIYLPNIEQSLALAVKQFVDNSKLSGLSGWIRVFPEHEKFMDYVGYVLLCDWQFYLKNNLLGIGCTCGEFQMMRRIDFQKLNGFREDLVVGEDLDLFYRLSKIGQTRTEPKILIYHTGRRPHEIGWSKLIGKWVMNWFMITFRNKSHDKEWKVIR